MELPLLKDPEQFPTNEVLENVLGESFSTYKDLVETITKDGYGLEPQWNYYKDGKAWLCKVIYKKKTVFWISVWDKHFKAAFYFNEKHVASITALDIDENLKESFHNEKHIGKLIPLILVMNNNVQINDLLTVVEFKKSLK